MLPKWTEVDEAIHYTYDYVERPIWQALNVKFDGEIFNSAKQIKIEIKNILINNNLEDEI